MLASQAARTPAAVEAARLDQEVSVSRFAVILGPGFTAQQLPRTFALAGAACQETSFVILAAKRLYEAGARKVEAAVAHAFFDADMASRMAEAGIERVISSDSVPHPTNELILAPLLAAALIEEMTR